MGVHVFTTMGTTVSLRFAGPTAAASALAGVEDAFDEHDRRFSLYRPDSELSRVARGELALTRSSVELRETYAEAIDWSARTGGAFTPHRPDGVIDLSGTVKARAIAAAAHRLDAAGETDWMLVAGGDILVAGAIGGEPWRAGVVDPDDRGALLTAVELGGRRLALATSGTAERGEHIWRGAGRASAPYSQVSVLAEGIMTADVLATALVAAGPERCQELVDRFDLEVLTVDLDGALTATAGFTQARGLARS
ncbi:FAD:protein FMN transferase [Herbiconiux sp. CPCC 205716]|uniref:FAD:protein FMN transferase n=1 Tax=Herbiconiux gentiana TaxID=2970912 RepID=A0ABT2GHW9_9MICO|nr:FAD:protein FMN transferase [Herbiconiux gentiana]MCS5715701.1 FAD:protein FMN transferase [Herbiconiux gentiana]